MSAPTWYAALLPVATRYIPDAWKFQATPTLQSAPEQRALDRHDARLLSRVDVFDVLWPWPLTFLTANWQPLGTSMPILIFLRFFCFRVSGPQGADRRTDGRARCVMRAIGRPHNNKGRLVLSAAKMFSMGSSFWRYKIYADIRGVVQIFMNISVRPKYTWTWNTNKLWCEAQQTLPPAATYRMILTC